MISPEIWSDVDVGSLSDGAFRVFIACISNADDHGKLECSAIRMRGIAFGFRSVSVAKVESYLQEIASKLRGFHRYEVDGRQYVKLLNWNRYQTIRSDKLQVSTIPDPVITEDRPKADSGQTEDSPETDSGQTEDSPETDSGHPKVSKDKVSKDKVSKDKVSEEASTPSPNCHKLIALLQQVKPGGNLTELDCFKAIARIYSEAHVIGAINKLASRSKYNQITPNYVRGMLERASKEGTLGEFLPLTVAASQDPPLDLYDVKYKKLWDAFEQEKKANGKSA